MNKIKRFFQNLVSSIVDFSYYKKIVESKFSFSLKYIFFLLVLLQLIGSIILAINIASYLPKVPSFTANLKKMAIRFYPDDLIVRFNNGRVSTNVLEPYNIDIPGQKMAKHLVTIDTKANIEDINKYNTFVLVTKNAVVYPDKNSSYKVQLLDQIKGNFIINKELYNKILPKLFIYLKYIPLVLCSIMAIVVIFGPVFSASFVLLGLAIYLLIGALIIFIFAKIFSRDLGYKKIYQLSFHAITLPLIISYTGRYLGFFWPGSVYILLYLALMMIIVWQFEKPKV